MKEESQEFEETCSNDEGGRSVPEATKSNPSVFKSRYRSPTFSKRETNYLLHCIMTERNYINNGRSDSVSRHERDQAWERVAEMYNKKFTDAQRTVKVLRNKYDNYKKQVKNESSEMKRSRYKPSNRNKTLNRSLPVNFNEFEKVVKIERDDMDGSNQDSSYYEPASNFEIMLTEKESENKVENSLDPLNAVLNGFTNTETQNTVCTKEDAEIVKLKMELLNYQLETAKMERERVKAAVEAEATERQKRSELLDLQIREAQISLSLGERKLNAQYPVNNVVHNSHYHVP